MFSSRIIRTRKLELELEFLFIVFFFFYKWHMMFPLFLYEVNSDSFTHNQAVFFKIYFIAFDFIVLFVLKFNPINLIETLYINVFLVN